jgi:regulatory protein
LNRPPARPAGFVPSSGAPVPAGPGADLPDRTWAAQGPEASGAAPKPDRALLRAAVAMLARRDFARAELGRRLLRRSAEPADGPSVERVLDYLQAKGMLSEERFAREFVRARVERYGPLRLRHELQRRGVDEDGIQAALASQPGDEFARARALWSRRFGEPPSTPIQRARQGRFLAARGFSHDVIRRVLGAPAFPGEEPDPHS